MVSRGRSTYFFLFLQRVFAALHGLFSSGEWGPLFVVVDGLLVLWNTGLAGGLQSLRFMGSGVRARNRGAQAQLLCCVWTLPGLGMEPVSPAVEGGFLATAPPGKFPQFSLILDLHISD